MIRSNFLCFYRPSKIGSNIDSNANKHRKVRGQGRSRSSVSVSSGDSDDDDIDTVDGSTAQKIRQRNSSLGPKETPKSSNTPPSFKESRFFHGR